MREKRDMFINREQDKDKPPRWTRFGIIGIRDNGKWCGKLDNIPLDLLLKGGWFEIGEPRVTGPGGDEAEEMGEEVPF